MCIVDNRTVCRDDIKRKGCARTDTMHELSYKHPSRAVLHVTGAAAAAAAGTVYGYTFPSSISHPNAEGNYKIKVGHTTTGDVRGRILGQCRGAQNHEDPEQVFERSSPNSYHLEQAIHAVLGKPSSRVASHPRVFCDKSGPGVGPIRGPRYNLVGANYDLCHTEFNKLAEDEKLNYAIIAKPHSTPVRYATAAAAAPKNHLLLTIQAELKTKGRWVHEGQGTEWFWTNPTELGELADRLAMAGY